MKKTIIIFILYISALGTFAQRDPDPFKQERESIINNVPFIFEGINLQNLSSVEGTFNSCLLVKVNRVFRGHEKLKYGKIKIIIKDNYNNTPVSDSLNTFFCNVATNPDLCTSTILTDNELVLELVGNLVYDRYAKKSFFQDLSFDGYESAIKFLEKYKNFTTDQKGLDKEYKIKKKETFTGRGRFDQCSLKEKIF